MARQRDRVDVNRTVGEHIRITSDWKVCYRFGAGQNTRTRIDSGGGGVCAAAAVIANLAVGSCDRAGGLSDGCDLGAVLFGRLTGSLSGRIVAEPCEIF